MQIRLALTFITALLFIALGLAWLTTFDEPEVPPTPSVQATERPQNFTPPVELTTQAIADTNSIDARLRNYFGSGNRTATRSVPPSHYYNAEKYNSLILLKAQLNNALDYGLGIENFLSYGLVPQQDGSLFLDIEKYPEWLSLDSLFQNLLNDSLREQMFSYLRALDFKQQSIEIINSYVSTTNPENDYMRNYLEMLNEVAENLSEGEHDRNEYRDSFIQMHDRSALMSGEMWRDWALTLADSLEREQLDILIDYLTDITESVTYYPSSLEQSVDRFIEEIATGSARNAIRSSLGL